MMRRFLVIALLLFVLPAQSEALFFWRAEATTLDATHDFSGGDATATANGSPAISSTGAKVGTNGLVFTSAASRYQFDSSTAVINPSLGSLGFWLRVNTWAPDQVVMSVRGSTGGNNAYTVDLTSLPVGQVRFLISSTAGASETIQTTGTAMVEGQWYFVVLRWDEAASLARAEVYNESLALISSGEDTNGFFAPADLTAADGLRFGDGSGSGALFNIDNVFVANTYAERLQDYALIASYTEYGGGGSRVPAKLRHYRQMKQ